ncbi:DUF488 domain-containing protein [Suttonella sp. R2A3]|uniref:DUF488 domain-containing protein n=1 Tax=Suttonella sp. R2A3 TaxID=2908648 RepID=UPI001F2690D3|nr:DUF488 domain-containing protein [Suttonella sp. R2A3]UJF23894.1 DUF488 domain-containing protein [Suttonella sp. R2A3]
MAIQTKRVYEEADEKDGFRILVDRLWPRGRSKEDAQVDVWLKSIAPSDELRKWFDHEEEKWLEFKKRYFTELDGNQEVVDELLSYTDHKTISLLFAAKDSKHNNAVALQAYIEKQLKGNTSN